MLVGERMSRPVITVSPELSIHEALNLMKKEHVSRLPVVKNGKLIGIVSDTDLLNASPSQATTLSVWELNYLLSKITVKDVMSSEAGGNFVALGTFMGEGISNRLVMFKVNGLDEMQTLKLVEPLVEKIIDIRTSNL